MKEIVFDSSTWLEYFSGTEKGAAIAEIVLSDATIYTPSICLAEIKNKYISENREYSDRIELIISRSRIININLQISILAGNKKKEWKLYMIDALIYAISVYLKSTLLTSDHHFQHLENIKVL